MQESTLSKDMTCANENETVSLAGAMARALSFVVPHIQQKGFNIRLTGNLGAGKTTLTRALLRTLNVTSRVKSPTFELVCDYTVLNGITLHHFDFYRFADPVEFDEAGFRDLFGKNTITICEWSDKAGEYLPQADIEITLTIRGEERDINLQAFSERGTLFLEAL